MTSPYLFFSYRFRWVVCQLKVLQDCFPSSLRQTLDQLPKSLDETYVRVLRQISHTNQAHAHRMLQCLMVAVRPLYVEELAELLAFEFDETQGGIPKYRGAWQLDDQTQAVLSTCSSLVTIVGTRYSGQIVQFSHFSVKEFLMSNRLGHLSQYHIHPISAHTILTQACLGFLLHLDDHIPKNSVKNYPLARYAAEHWVKHIQYGDIASRVKEGVETLFDPDRPHFAAWVGIYDIDEARLSKLSMPHFSVPPIRKPNPLYYSVLCGFFDLVKHVALKHPHYVNAMCGGYRFPLFAALEEDRIDIVELLLEHGANVDARGAMGETILLRVLSWPQRNLVNLVNLLLKHEPDVNARDGFFRSSLHLAEYNGELAVAEMLVKQKADVNSQDKYGKTPLLILAKRGKYSEDDVIGHAWSLLEHGADVNIRDKGNEIPLHLAIRNAWFKFASILLEQGADTTAENSEGKTPLHVLSDSQTENEDDVLNHALLLLEHGAEVNIRDKDNETPLHLALRQAWFRFARILLDHGADANAKNNNGISPLHVLAERGICDKGNVGEVLRTLLEYSTEVNRRYDDNGTSSVQEIGTGMYEFPWNLLTKSLNKMLPRRKQQAKSQCPKYHKVNTGPRNVVLLLQNYHSSAAWMSKCKPRTTWQCRNWDPISTRYRWQRHCSKVVPRSTQEVRPHCAKN
jgi:ankyrin repeat protein